MKTLVEQITELTQNKQNILGERPAENRKGFSADPNFGKLGEFYKRAKENGFAKKPEYTLPMLDTIGRYKMKSF